MVRHLHINKTADTVSHAIQYCTLLRAAGSNDSIFSYDFETTADKRNKAKRSFTNELYYAFNSKQLHKRLDDLQRLNLYRHIKYEDATNLISNNHYESHLILSKDWAQTLSRYSRRYGKDWMLSEEDITLYKPLVDVLSTEFFRNYPVIFSYGDAVIPTMLSSIQPYVPVIINPISISELLNTVNGKLLAFAFRTAPHLIITDLYSVHLLKELGVKRFTYIPEPIDIEISKSTTEVNQTERWNKYGASYLFFASEYQHWNKKRNDKVFEAFREILSNNIEAKLIVIEHGPDLERSKNLVRELDISNHVIWLQITTEQALLDVISSVDLVIGQPGNCEVIGPIAIRALACGIPVAISYNKSLYKQIFSEIPPLIEINDVQSIRDSLINWVTRKNDYIHLKKDCRKWALKYHSNKVILSRFNFILDDILSKSEKGASIFASLKQKKLELEYEGGSVDIYDEKYHSSPVYKYMDDILINIVKKNIAENRIKNVEFLDLGCGPGSLTAKLREIQGIRLIGADISPAMIKKAKRKYPDVDFRIEDCEVLSFEDKSFDVVFCSGMLHHLPNLSTTLKEIKRVLKPGGLFVAREPNDDNFALRHPKLAFAHLCLRHYLFNALKKQEIEEPDAHEYHRSFDFQNLTETIGNSFYVKDFHTGLMVSYFYNMLNEENDLSNYIHLLDDSLSEQPGLNIIFVAQKSDKIGIKKSLIEQLRCLKKHHPIEPRHFNNLINFSQKIFGSFEGNFYKKIVNTKKIKSENHVNKLMSHYSDGNKLVINILKNKMKIQTYYDKKINIKELDLNLLEIELQKYKKKYSVGQFSVNHQLKIKYLIDILECVRDYGLIYIRINGCIDASNASQKDIDYLKQINVLGMKKAKDNSQMFFLLSRYLFSSNDFYKAISVAIENDKNSVHGNNKVNLDDVAKKIKYLSKQTREKYCALERKYFYTILTKNNLL